MSRSRRLLIGGVVASAGVAAIIGGILAIGGIGGSDDDGDDDGGRTVQPGAPGEESRELTDEEAQEAVEAPRYTQADATFMQDMIVHHQQALDMAVLVDERTRREDLPVLAERISVTQEDEIGLMEEWLDERGEEVPDVGPNGHEHHEHHELMPGMATADQLDQLERAQGTAFDRLFLELMITHHQGALTMVEDLYAAGGGLEPAADGFARDVVADQTIEIERMQELLASLPEVPEGS